MQYVKNEIENVLLNILIYTSKPEKIVTAVHGSGFSCTFADRCQSPDGADADSGLRLLRARTAVHIQYVE